ncbi:MAG: hydrolase [Micrococcales bacterium]|nr:MAG: hydrolase [Micrococcales bacterium]PIE26238.1 MAG: hydrolase [Micrococcales bacterium]
MTAVTRTGPANSFTDLAGTRVGHATRRDAGWLTGTSVVLAPAAGMVAGVDVRGGGPGTRETDLLDPRNLVERVHAIVLTGGSAFGLGAAQGVMQGLYEDRIGLPVDGPSRVVPIVPAAVIFDLGRGGHFDHWPDAELGMKAYQAAKQGQSSTMSGSVGAGAGAVAGGLKGGVGSASAVLADGVTVSAVVVVNCAGSVADPRTGELYARRYLDPAEHVGLGVPARIDVVESARRATELPVSGLSTPGFATTIGVVGTDVTLTKAQCAKMAAVAHDGLARAVRPVHSMVDGDTFFGISTATRPAPQLAQVQEILGAAADVVSRAVANAVLEATAVATAAGSWRSYRDAFPSAFTGARRPPPGS